MNQSTEGAIDVVLAGKEKKGGRRIPLEVDGEIISKEEQMSEYWHYSYGDAYWAVRRKDKITMYGIPTSNLFKEQ